MCIRDSLKTPRVGIGIQPSQHLKAELEPSEELKLGGANIPKITEDVGVMGPEGLVSRIRPIEPEVAEHIGIVGPEGLVSRINPIEPGVAEHIGVMGPEGQVSRINPIEPEVAEYIGSRGPEGPVSKIKPSEPEVAETNGVKGPIENLAMADNGVKLNKDPKGVSAASQTQQCLGLKQEREKTTHGRGGYLPPHLVETSPYVYQGAGRWGPGGREALDPLCVCGKQTGP